MEGISGYVNALEAERGGFVFRANPLADQELVKKTISIDKSLVKAGGALNTLNIVKTGTTICGAIYKDGVVLAADTQATIGTLVCIRNIQKIQWITPNIWAAGAGSAAELTHVIRQLQAEMKLFEYNAGIARVETVVARLCQRLFKYQGYIQLAAVIGGVNPTGESHLCMVTPEGYRRSFPYLAMGSGGYFATGILENGYRDDLSKEEAMELVANAIEAGITHDQGSGSNVDVVVIESSDPRKPKLTRSFRTPVKQFKKPQGEIPLPEPSKNLKIIKETRRAIQPYSNDLPLNVQE